MSWTKEEIKQMIAVREMMEEIATLKAQLAARPAPQDAKAASGDCPDCRCGRTHMKPHLELDLTALDGYGGAKAPAADGVREALLAECVEALRVIAFDPHNALKVHQVAESAWHHARDWRKALAATPADTAGEGKPNAEQWEAIREGILCGWAALEIEFDDTARAYFKQAHDAVRALAAAEKEKRDAE